MNRIIPSSTGGAITPIIENGVQVGIRHTARSGAYSGRLAETNTNAVVFDAPKRGRGRPKKTS
jgi:hypothetical protein